MEIQIDSEFKALISPLKPEEYAQLEANIIADGCREALVVWDRVLIDGHNRYAICTKHGIKFETTAIEFSDRYAAMDWMDRNQLGRRNLTPDQFTFYLGRLYNRQKRANGQRGPEKLDQFAPASTAEKLASEHGVSSATVKRAGQIAGAVTKAVSEIQEAVRNGTLPVSQAAKLADASPEFQRAVAKRIEDGHTKPSDAIRDERRSAIVERLDDISTREAKVITGVYDVIVIDPPWPMQKIERDVRPNQSEFDYPTMTEDELSALKIPMADDCHVWLWTTQKFLPMALRLLDTWGMRYVCTFVWHKSGGFQPIGLPQFNCEFALYARHGKPEFIDTKALPTCFEAARGAHSEKPEAFYEVVRRVTAGRKLDMFNRRNIVGFETWGNESEAA